MPMKKTQPIEIRQLANGYAVFPSKHLGECVDDNDRMVFQTFAELTTWLGVHFTHRTCAVKTDTILAD